MSESSAMLKNWKGTDIKIRGKRVVGKTAYEVGLVVESIAKSLSAIKTGRLKGSITTQSRDKGTRPDSPATGNDVIEKPGDNNEVLVGTAVEYAPYIEYGTVRHGAQPFLRPALDLARGNAVAVGMKNGKREFTGYLK